MVSFARNKRCPTCQGVEPRRISRKLWMRLIPASEYYLCRHCSQFFIICSSHIALEILCEDSGKKKSKINKMPLWGSTMPYLSQQISFQSHFSIILRSFGSAFLYSIQALGMWITYFNLHFYYFRSAYHIMRCGLQEQRCELRDVIYTRGVIEVSPLYPILHPLKPFRIAPLTFSIVATVFFVLQCK